VHLLAPQCSIDDLCGKLVADGHQLAVGVDGRRDRLVAETRLDVRKRQAVGDQPRDVRVPQIVNPERCETARADTPISGVQTRS
jgi:hypothetical protein